MASKMADTNLNCQPLCPICLEAPPTLKVGTTCNHVFCRNCLLKHLRGASLTNDRFPCPTCRVECQLPANGIDGLMAADTIFNSERATGTSEATRQATPNEPCAWENPVSGESGDGQQCCQICKFTKNTSIDADKICEDCGKLYLCKECTLVHGTNKHTEHHYLIPCRPENVVEGRCAAHGQWITYYCCTCSSPVCRICIHIGHGEHTLTSFAEVFHGIVEEVQSKMKEQERRLNEFRSREDALKGCGQLSLERKSMLVKSVEDKAEKCIERITKQKEALKERIEADFQPILQLTACVDKIPIFRTKMGDLVAEADRVVTDAEPCLSGLGKLSSISARIDETAKLVENRNGDQRDYLESYTELWQKLPLFVPNVPDCNIGSVSAAARSDWGIDKCKLIFEKELQVDDKAKFIPCVTGLGNGYYAVAQPTNSGQPAKAIDIYRYPGVHQLAIQEYANPTYGMAATPDGNLAVLSDGKTENSCSVRLFHPTTGYLRSTNDLDVRGWLSFDVNIRHQYVILSNDGSRKVTIFNGDGTVVLTHSVDVKEFNIMDTACRITCSIRHIYVMGNEGFAIYKELKGGGLTVVKVRDESRNSPIMTDISVGYFDRLAFCYCKTDASRIITFKFHNRELLHRDKWESKICAQSADKVASISVRDDYIVSSQGHTIRVFNTMSNSVAISYHEDERHWH